MDRFGSFPWFVVIYARKMGENLIIINMKKAAGRNDSLGSGS
jgi:hypothetical protein